MRFINWWKEQCCEILDAPLIRRKKMAKQMEIVDDEMHSRYDKIQRGDGLFFASVEIFNVMAELRLEAGYGDYLPYTCAALKGEAMNDMIWIIDKLDWQADSEASANVNVQD